MTGRQVPVGYAGAVPRSVHPDPDLFDDYLHERKIICSCTDLLGSAGEAIIIHDGQLSCG